MEQIARSYLKFYLYEAECRGERIDPVDLRLEINRATGAITIVPVLDEGVKAVFIM